LDNANLSKLRQLRKFLRAFLWWALPAEVLSLNLARLARKRALTSFEQAEQYQNWLSQIKTDIEPN
jgi:hypothetical protein